MDWKTHLSRTPYLVLFIVLISIGAGTASAMITITLAGNVIVTGNLDVEGALTGPTIESIEQKFNILNKPPTVEAGNNQNVILGSDAILDGTVIDEGLPSGIVTTIWTKDSGPGVVIFDDSTMVDTTASLSAVGQYVLRLTASDGSQSAFDELLVTVISAPSSPDVGVPSGTSVPGCETTNECYIPYEIFVNVGDEVTWSNDDSAAHTVTSGSAADGPSGVFDSSLFMAGTTFSHTFTGPGTFEYFCMVHPWMEGIVHVSGTPVITDVSVPQGTSVPGCEATNACYIPYELFVNVGDEVTWSNDDSAAHTVTSGSAADGPSGIFDSSLFMAGTTFSHTFTGPGTFEYFCMVHPWMEGIVHVSNP
jgi:plastocyanin